MNNDDALYLLGIEGADDTDAVRQAYERRRLEFEQRLTNTSNEGLKHKYHSTLSDLDQAYRMLLSSSDSIPDPTVRREQRSKMRSANSSAVGSHASTGGTLLRSEGDAFAATSGLTIGHVLAGRYEIRRVLGQGGMGAVYEAFDQLKQESVAIKVLLPQYLGSEQGRDRFMHEAKVACRLAHPNIVKVFDVGLAEPYHFITMELLEGETLRAQMERRKADRETYSAAAVLDCARQLIEALDYAHKQIVHRDLKPENVWVSPDGTLKLIDFGIARAFTKSALTRTGMVMGTAYYMAPEQFDGAKDVDWRADQYSLAVILYELLTGRVPLGTFAATSELRKDVPISLSRALMKALSPDASNRFDSLANFRTALSSRNTTRFFNRKPIAWSVAAAAMLVVVGLLVGGVFRRAPQSIATSSAVSTSPAVAATALEGEVLSLFKRLQDKEQEIADNVTQQQLRYDHAAATQAAREYRELQLRHEIQQETQDTVFSERQWSASSGQIHAGQALLQTHDVAEATAQLTAARDTLLGNAKLADDIENFVRARADYFDARQPWLDYSLKHAGISPTNPAIHAAEATIQAKIDRGEFAALASDVFPRLAGLYTDELRSAQQREEQQRSAKVTGKPTRPDAVQTPSEAADEPRIPTQNTAPETKSAEKSAPLTKREIKAQRKHDALMEKCAKTHYRSHGCPPAPASN